MWLLKKNLNEKYDKLNDYTLQISLFEETVSFLINWEKNKTGAAPFNKIYVTYDCAEYNNQICLFLKIVLNKIYEDESHNQEKIELSDLDCWNKFDGLGFKDKDLKYESSILLGKMDDFDVKCLSEKIHERAYELFSKEINSLKLSVVKL